MDIRSQNKFYMTKHLLNSVSKIINSREDTYYVCKVINYTIPEHSDLVFKTVGGNFDYKNDKEKIMNNSCQEFVEVTVPANNYSYFVVMREKFYEAFLMSSYNSKNELAIVLKVLSAVYTEYNGTIDPGIFYNKFPYMKDFFQFVNKDEENKVVFN